MDLSKIHERLAVIETKLDALLLDLHPLANRLTVLERWRSYLLGAGALFGAALTLFGAVLTWLLAWKSRGP